MVGFEMKTTPGMSYYIKAIKRPKWIRDTMASLLQDCFDKQSFHEIIPFIRKYPNMIDFFIPQYGTAIVAAVKYEKKAIVTLLLGLGADPLEFNGFSTDKVNVFNVGSSLEILEIILVHIKDWQEPASVGAIICAFRKVLRDLWETGDFSKAELYLKYRPDLINTKFEVGTVLSCAIKFGDNERVIKYMKMGADPWNGKTDPMRFQETQEDIVDYIMKETKVFQGGELWDYWT